MQWQQGFKINCWQGISLCYIFGKENVCCKEYHETGLFRSAVQKQVSHFLGSLGKLTSSYEVRLGEQWLLSFFPYDWWQKFPLLSSITLSFAFLRFLRFFTCVSWGISPAQILLMYHFPRILQDNSGLFPWTWPINQRQPEIPFPRCSCGFYESSLCAFWGSFSPQTFFWLCRHQLREQSFPYSNTVFSLSFLYVHFFFFVSFLILPFFFGVAFSLLAFLSFFSFSPLMYLLSFLISLIFLFKLVFCYFSWDRSIPQNRLKRRKSRKKWKISQILNQTKRNINKFCLGKISHQKQ